jgi:TRAP-type C4-dicarboxylate transport system permease small subunit
MIKRLNTGCAYLNKAVSVVASLFFLVLVVSCVLQVFTRFVLNNSLRWTEELARYCFIWTSMLGATICTYHSGHAVVTVILNLFKGKARVVMDILISLCVAGVGFMLMQQGWIVAAKGAVQLSAALRLSMRYVYLSGCVAGAILLIYSVVDILNKLSALFHGEESGKEGGGNA